MNHFVHMSEPAVTLAENRDMTCTAKGCACWEQVRWGAVRLRSLCCIPVRRSLSDWRDVHHVDRTVPGAEAVGV
jgi:hypothetical protein